MSIRLLGRISPSHFSSTLYYVIIRMACPTSIGPGKISYEDDYGSSQGHIHINVGHRHGSSLKFPTRKGSMTVEDVREHGSREYLWWHVFWCNSTHLEL